MNSKQDVIRQALAECLGPPKVSLNIESRSKGGRREYYYRIKRHELVIRCLKAYRKEGIRDKTALGLLRIRQETDAKGRTEKPLVVSVECSEEETALVFMSSREIGFYIDEHREIGARIIPERHPMFTMTVSEHNNGFYFRSGREQIPFRFTPYINKCIKSVETVQKVLCAVFRSLSEVIPVLGDISVTLQKDRCLAIPLSLNEMSCYKNGRDLLKHRFDHSDILEDTEDLSMNQAYCLSVMGLYIRTEDRTELVRFCRQNTDYISVLDQYGEIDPARFLSRIYMHKHATDSGELVYESMSRYVKNQMRKEELLTLDPFPDGLSRHRMRKREKHDRSGKQDQF
ncbi:MAG: hypothetical protein IJM50_00965 [Lachnospiraceae bacterium]|nr:hypothetical protein [Lachnospiraceae bacterium]